jgi:hypothetical protein
MEKNMNSENKEISAINQDSIESTESWKDPSLPIANLKLQSIEEAVEWGVIAAALALKVAEGAASRVGQKMIDGLFGGDQNFTSLNRNAIAAIGSVVKQSISEEALTQCNIKLQGMQEQMQLYKNAPESNRFRLEAALTQISSLIIDLKRFEVIGVGSFAMAATLHLGMLLEFAFRSADPGNLTSVKQLIVGYIAHAQLMKAQLNAQSLLVKTTPCSCLIIDPTESRPTESVSEDSDSEEDSIIEAASAGATCRYFDGEDWRFFRGPGSAGNRIKAECAQSYSQRVRFLQQQLNEQISAIDKIINTWKTISSSV